jgi:glycosyltransferase involved in cell wall biosynthesis
MLPFKGIWDLLSAAHLLKDRQDIQFHIYGGNSRSDAFLRSWVGTACSTLGLAQDIEGQARTFVARHGLEKTVNLLGNVTPDASLFRSSDILAFPSHLNGIGRSVFEAGVFGVPSVVAMRDPVQDIVEDGVTGLIVKPRNPVELANAIGRLADDAGLRRRLGENARRKYSVQFDPERIGKQMVSIYRNVLLNREVAVQKVAPERGAVPHRAA